MSDLVFVDFPPVVSTQEAQNQYTIARNQVAHSYVTIKNQLQFLPNTDPDYQTVIDYANASIDYAESTLERLPPPVTNPFFLPILPIVSPPDTTGFSQIAIDTVNICLASQTESYEAYERYDLFFSTPQEPSKWSQEQLKEILNSYVPLLIRQYSKYGKGQNAYCFNLFFARIITEYSNAFNNILQAFQLPVAVGKQLDCLGEYIGPDRKFIWTSEDGTETFYNLTDDQYRIILYMAIGAYQSNCSYASIGNTLYLLFNKSVTFVFDNTVVNVMTLFYLAIGLNYLQRVSFAAAVSKNVLPRPAGVGVVVAFGDKPFFSFSTGNNLVESTVEKPGFALSYSEFFDGEFLGVNGLS